MNLNFEVINSSYDVRDYHINAATEFPKEFQCTTLTAIKNQGSQSTCVAHALASLLEYHYQTQSDNVEIFSTEFIYGLREAGYYTGDGMMIRNGLNTILKYGDPFEKDCPGNNPVDEAIKNVNANLDHYKELAYPHHISSYYRCRNEAEIKTALMQHGPVVISMNTYNNAKLVDDVYTWSSNEKYGRHCVLIVGWNEQGWLIQNSWGTHYGEDGRFILPYSFKINEAWGITDTIQDSELSLKKPSAFIRFISSTYNVIINFFKQLFGKK